MGNDYYEEVRHHKFESNVAPLVSVVMTAYNIGDYLEEAIESVLSQKTNFKIELIIGENCSQDNSRAILKLYKDKFPGIIQALLHETNIGLTPNSIATQNACTGKYIAFCDGDDYWTDSNKLQKQIEFLESNSDYSASCHQAETIYMDGSTEAHLFGQTTNTTFGVNDTLFERKFHTSSLVYRQEIWDMAEGIPANILSNDRAIYIMVAMHGKISYLNDVMCIYRKSSSGISSSASMNELKRDVNMIPWIKKLDRDYPYLKFESFLHLNIFGAYKAGLLNLKLFRFVKHYLLFVILSFSYFPNNLGDVKYGSIRFLKILRKNAQ